ncbi:hypothetical protein SLA2020_527610 [Shorea laevis]
MVSWPAGKWGMFDLGTTFVSLVAGFHITTLFILIAETNETIARSHDRNMTLVDPKDGGGTGCVRDIGVFRKKAWIQQTFGGFIAHLKEKGVLSVLVV